MIPQSGPASGLVRLVSSPWATGGGPRLARILFFWCLLLLLLYGRVSALQVEAPPAEYAERLEEARNLLTTGNPGEALALARDLLAEQPTGSISDQARILICSLPRSLREEGQDSASLIEDENDWQTRRVERPTKIHAPTPRYTELARQNGTEGLVIAQATVNTDGCVASVKLLRGLPDGLSEATEEVVATWVFQPGTVDGKAMPMVSGGLPVNFKLTAAPPEPSRISSAAAGSTTSGDRGVDASFEEAVAAYRRAVDRNPGDAKAWRSLGDILRQSGHFEKAAEAYRRVLVILPRDFFAALNLGSTLLQSEGRNEHHLREAERAFRQALDVTAHREHLSKILRESDDVKETVAVARGFLQESRQGPLPDQARRLVCELRQGPPREVAVPNASAAASGAVFVTGDVKKPVKIFEVEPQYTEEGRKARTTGVVILQTIIDKEGCITNVKVLKGLPDGISESAVAAIKKWVYRPATLNGKPIAVYFNLTVNFQLQRQRRRR